MPDRSLRLPILVTPPAGPARDRIFPPALRARLERVGPVRWNPLQRQWTAEEFAAELDGKALCVTGWNAPRLQEWTLGQLRLVAHVGGSVAGVVSESVYAAGVIVCSANTIMARFVAEGILAYILAGLRDVPRLDRLMHDGVAWPREPDRIASLHGARVGFVGLGSVGRELLALLQPFQVDVAVYDPYVPNDELKSWPRVRPVGLDEVMGGCDVISIHASLTAETKGLLDIAQLARIRNGAVLVNAARGQIIDEAALEAQLATGRFRAVLDVFQEEPLAESSRLRQIDNVILVPHLAGAASHRHLAEAMVAEIERFAAGLPLCHRIPMTQFNRMTRATE